MPTPAVGTEATLDSAAGRVLVCSAARPPIRAERCIDVRPGAVATFDGERLRLQLTVSGPEGRVRVAWLDRRRLDDVVASMLEAGPRTVVQFGDRSACRRMLGRVGADSVERRLAATARAGSASLVTWTALPRCEVEPRVYEMVVDRATGSG